MPGNILWFNILKLLPSSERDERNLEWQESGDGKKEHARHTAAYDRSIYWMNVSLWTLPRFKSNGVLVLRWAVS